MGKSARLLFAVFAGALIGWLFLPMPLWMCGAGQSAFSSSSSNKSTLTPFDPYGTGQVMANNLVLVSGVQASSPATGRFPEIEATNAVASAISHFNTGAAP